MRPRSAHSRKAVRRIATVAAADLNSMPETNLSSRGVTFRVLVGCAEVLTLHHHLKPGASDLGELFEDLVRGRWKVSAERVQVGAPERHERNRTASPSGAPAHHLSHRRQFIDRRGRLQRRQQQLLAAASAPRNLHQPAAQHEESCARLPLLGDVLPVAIRALVDNPCQMRQISMREVLKKIRLLEKANQVGGWLMGRLRYGLEQRTRWNRWRIRLIHTFLAAAQKSVDTHQSGHSVCPSHTVAPPVRSGLGLSLS